jgi:hypothetical protein
MKIPLLNIVTTDLCGLAVVIIFLCKSFTANNIISLPKIIVKCKSFEDLLKKLK